MPFWRLYYHLVWATRRREPRITPDIEPQLYRCVVDKAAELEIWTYAINGWTDHLHLLVSIPPKFAVSYVVAQIKGASSHYVNHVIDPGGDFAWQQGYGALSVGEAHRHIAEAYINGQKQHHAQDRTIAALERAADIDEGPTGLGLPPEGRVREADLPYQVVDIPF